jgi:hypothetical protein
VVRVGEPRGREPHVTRGNLDTRKLTVTHGNPDSACMEQVL